MYPEMMRFTAAVDRRFLEGVKDSFSGLGITAQMVATMALVVVALVLVLVLAHYVNKYKSKFTLTALPTGWIMGRMRMGKILQEALEQRSGVELSFLPAEQARKALVLSLADITDEAIVLEVPEYVSVGRSWIDRRVECFFKIQDPKKKQQMLFYRFQSTILGVRKLSSGMAHLLLAFPKNLEMHQKRAFLRLDPPAHYILGFALWPQRTASATDPAHYKKWGKPTLTYIPRSKQNPLAIENISAGGLRLHVRHTALQNSWISFNIAQRFFMLLDLFDPESGQKRRFWLQCRVQNTFEDHVSKDIEVGMKFIAVGHPSPSDPERLIWTRLGDEGIESLASWIMKRHLEMFREKGLA
jgi:hypothetical protein